jgi:hypothetical protein
MLKVSNIAIGEDDSFDFDGPITARFNSNDPDYPVSIEGITGGGNNISISLTPDDIDTIMGVLQDQYY